MTAEEAKRRSGGRNSMGRRLRGMKRIMGKKFTPPTSPARIRSIMDECSVKSYSPVSVGGLSRRSGGGIVGGVGSSSYSPRSELTVEGSDEADMSMMSQGKAFLEGEEGEEDGEGREGAGRHEEADDGSPIHTASLSTGNGASSHASPASYDGKEIDGGGGGGGGGGGSAALLHVA